MDNADNPINESYGRIICQASANKCHGRSIVPGVLYGTGKIVEQIWKGINSARVLLAELAGRNANVLYELGLAHELDKPVVLVCSTPARRMCGSIFATCVIDCDKDDPFWGTKLMEKIAEKILSVLQDPKDSILFPPKVALFRSGVTGWLQPREGRLCTRNFTPPSPPTQLHNFWCHGILPSMRLPPAVV